MTDTLLKSVHSSGRFDGSVQGLVSDLDAWTATHSIITRTEIASPRWAPAFDALTGMGWAWFHDKSTPGTRECMVAWNPNVWGLVEQTAAELHAPGGRGRFRFGQYAATVVLQHVETGALAIVSTAHARAHVQTAKGWRKLLGRVTARVRAYWADDAAHYAHVETLRAKYPDAAVLVAKDWNLDGRVAWVRKWIESRWPAYRQAFPTTGTHGKQAIDGWVTTTTPSPVTVLPAKSSDHEAISATFTHTVKGVPPVVDTVKSRGTDSSGRPILMSDYMASWWEGYTFALGFVPTITQGAWMERNGGGAAGSAGYHDKGGCLDLRVWDRTTAEVEQMVSVARALGAPATWLRNVEHGGFSDPHVHLVVGGDTPMSSGAAWQISEVLAGRDGLSSRGADYGPRSNLQKTPPKEAFMPTASEIAKAVWGAELPKADKSGNMRAGVMLSQVHNRAGNLRVLVKALADAESSLDEAALERAFRKVLGSLDEATP